MVEDKPYNEFYVSEKYKEISEIADFLDIEYSEFKKKYTESINDEKDSAAWDTLLYQFLYHVLDEWCTNIINNTKNKSKKNLEYYSIHKNAKKIRKKIRTEKQTLNTLFKVNEELEELHDKLNVNKKSSILTKKMWIVQIFLDIALIYFAYKIGWN